MLSISNLLPSFDPVFPFALSPTPATRPSDDGLLLATYPSALGPSTSGGSLTTPKSRAALTASTSGPELVLSSVHAIVIRSNG